MSTAAPEPPAAAPADAGPRVPADCTPPGIYVEGYGAHVGEHDKEMLAGWIARDLSAACTAQAWDVATYECFQYVGVPGDQGRQLSTCYAMLKPDAAKALEAKITSELSRAEAILKAPPSCDSVVASYYGDDDWKGHATPRLNAKQRKQAIAQSRDLLARACKEWSPLVAQCWLDAKHKEDVEFCWNTVDSWAYYRWVYPASAIEIPTGIAECDVFTELAKKPSCKSSQSLVELMGQRGGLFTVPRGSVLEREYRVNCKALVAQARTRDGCSL